MQGRIEESLGGFRVEVTNQLGRAFEVGKQHRHLFALAFQGTGERKRFSGREREVWRKGAQGGEDAGIFKRGLGRRVHHGRHTTVAKPDEAAPCLVVHLRMGKEEFILGSLRASSSS